jgi:protein-tyrosine phosphatase
MADPALLAERRLVWPACDNVRDLGGLPAANANVTRHGSIVRADCLTGLTDAGWHALAVHGVRTIIDLRDPDDRSRAPHTLPDSVARAGGLDLLSLPLRCAGPRVDALLAGAETLEESYVITVEHCQANVAAILRAIVGARPGGIAIHCQSGRDRTAIIAALLLALAGVPAYVITLHRRVSFGRAGRRRSPRPVATRRRPDGTCGRCCRRTRCWSCCATWRPAMETSQATWPRSG